MKFVQHIKISAFIIISFAACSKETGVDASSASGTGKGGSLARFTIAANHLYLADYATVEVYDINDPANPVKKNSVSVDFGIETIFPYQDKLFIGSTTGMFIYSITNPASPVKLAEARHVRSCDPVVANGTTAYVTLRGGSPCGPAEDGLYIYDITNVSSPVQKSLLRISTPYGLGVKDTIVYVCRGSNGLSVVNVKNPSSPKLMYTITEGNNFNDVIPYGNLLICYIKAGLLIYDITNPNQLIKLGTVLY
jgi:hypothetical protein